MDTLPIIHSSTIFANHGWKVVHLGLKGWGSQDLSIPAHPNIDVIQLDNPPQNRFGRVKGLLQFAQKALKLCRSIQPDLLYVSDPTTTPIAVLLKTLTDIPIIYHEHDAFQSTGNLYSKLNYHSRGIAGTKAALTVFPNEGRRQLFIDEHGECDHSAIVLNCPGADEVKLTDEKSTEHFIIYYHGSLVPSRVPMTLLDALKRLPDEVHFRFAGYETMGHHGFIKDVMARAQELKIEERVRYVGKPKYREQLLDECEQASLGLAFMPNSTKDDNERTMAGASNKAFDYLSRKVPLLINDLDDWRALFDNYSFVCDPSSVESLTETILYCYNNRDEIQGLANAGQKVIEQWNYQTQFAPVLKFAEELTNG